MNQSSVNIDTGSSSYQGRATVESSVSGVLVIDKPEGMTSFQAADRVGKRLRLKKVGHCGTLDPFATGVLVLCLNQATRVSDLLSSQEKLYEAVIRLGAETDTLDRTGQVTGQWDGLPPAEGEIRAALASFLGAYVQEVPRYAAVKVKGRRLYEWSREGIQVDLPSREIHIHSIELLGYCWPDVSVEVKCSKGTYIRQLASDIGRLLGCGAHVAELKRTASGPFRIDQALSLDEVDRNLGIDELIDGQRGLIPINEALAHLPAVAVEDETVLKRLSNGQLDPGWEARHRESFAQQRNPVRIVSGENHLLALWWPHAEAGKRRRLRLFAGQTSFITQNSSGRETKED